MAVTLNLGRGACHLLAVFCIFMLTNTAESLDCYKCDVSMPNANDNCLKTAVDGIVTETCLKGISKCHIKRTINTGSNTITQFKRGCNANILGLGADNECETAGGVETCTTVCDNEDLCNRQSNADMEQCAKHGTGCSTGSLPSQAKFLMIGAVAVVFKLYF